jgi:DNA-binding response OmpR family regulator
MCPTCLIGESDTFLARLLARFCEASGVSVTRAQVGEELFALARRYHPDLIIFDVELPGEQRGWEAVKMLKESADWEGARLISCSWLVKPEAVALVPDCVAHLQKPDLHYDDFVAALKAAGFEPA